MTDDERYRLLVLEMTNRCFSDVLKDFSWREVETSVEISTSHGQLKTEVKKVWKCDSRAIWASRDLHTVPGRCGRYHYY